MANAGSLSIKSYTAVAARWSARLGGGMILLAVFLVAAEVVARNLGLGVRLHAFDLTNYAFAAAIAFGFSFALIERAHIRIDLVYQRLPLGLRAWLDAIALTGLAVMACGMAWQAWRVVAASLKLGARPNSTLDIPLAIPQAVWATGLTWFALVATVLSVIAAAGLVRGRLAEVHAASGVISERET